MKSKKTLKGKKEIKKTKPVAKKVSKPVAKAKPAKVTKPAVKKVSKPAAAPKSAAVKQPSVSLSKPMKVVNRGVKETKIPEIFKNFYRE
jgi:hypothetical protein